jgi:hypothetical protein
MLDALNVTNVPSPLTTTAIPITPSIINAANNIVLILLTFLLVFLTLIYLAPFKTQYTNKPTYKTTPSPGNINMTNGTACFAFTFPM